jgi:uncharacterized protein YbjT (DUF2867 family)
MRLFIAGATGATGQVLVPMAAAAGHDLVLHVRPQSAARSPLGADPRARVFELGDPAALAGALAGCEAVISLVGTMRNRFKAGDTYESSDVGTTQQLADGAKAAGVGRFLLLGSYGAGGAGAYLKMKARCEQIVKDSGLRYTIFRPSMLVSPADAAAGTHGQRKAPPGVQGLFGLLRGLPGLAGLIDDVRPIPIEVLCRAFLRVLAEPRDGETLSGRQIWSLAARRPGPSGDRGPSSDSPFGRKEVSIGGAP